ncbi:Baculoviral IAP repeat-containing protein 1e [Lamellibrachia satsuma]|nr:Baculoviral IAP repeat-containing protein 1e [Lamellibrachia satsuma]
MDLYFKRLVNGPPFRRNEEMRYEGVRLITFNHWPNWAAVWPTQLARAGFYYTKTADKVACFCCSGRLKTWEAGDSPLTEHKRFFPQCQFVTGRDTRNVPLGEPPGQGSHTCNPHAPSDYCRSLASYARHNRPSSSLALEAQVQQKLPYRGQQHKSLPTTSAPDGPMRQHMLADGTRALTDRSFSLEQLQDMKLESKRLESFTNWPTIAYICPENLAKAGLYYLGTADRVKCAFCNGILRNWKLGDEPEMVHRSFFPNCAFFIDAWAARNVTIDEERDNNQQAAQNVVANPTPSSELGVVTESPIHQNYAIEADRLPTFRQRPHDSNQSPEALAGAGFLYTGRPVSRPPWQSPSAQASCSD